jgi:hypothetical protein
VEVKDPARADSAWAREEVNKLVWAPSCVDYAEYAKMRMENTMCPHWAVWYLPTSTRTCHHRVVVKTIRHIVRILVTPGTEEATLK